MARRCSLTGKQVLVGNTVSHANNKNKTRFLPNLQPASFFSDVLQRRLRLRLSTNAIRTVEKAGGIDAYVAAAKKADLPKVLLPLKNKLDAAASA